MKLGVALSLYDKFDQLKTNVSIIRNHWNSHNDSYISVCCNNNSLIGSIQDLEVDKVTKGDDIPYVDKPSRRMRIVDCIQKSILGCESDFIIHYHSDAYAVKIEPILEIIGEMEKNNYHVAYRGKGIEYRNNKNFAGDVDDHYVIFRRSELIKRSALDLNRGEMARFLQVGNPETLLSFVISNIFLKEEIFHYDNMSKNVVHESCVDPDNFYGDNIRHRHMNPFNFDVNRGFYHIGDSEIILKTLVEAGVPEDIVFTPNSLNQKSHVQEWLDE